MRKQYDTCQIGLAVPQVFEAAELDHVRASLSGRLEPACFTISPEALATVRAAAQIAGVTQGAIVSAGIALACEILCRREGPAFREVLAKRQAENLKALGGPSCSAPGKK
jgi:hypothetical protein